MIEERCENCKFWERYRKVIGFDPPLADPRKFGDCAKKHFTWIRYDNVCVEFEEKEK